MNFHSTSIIHSAFGYRDNPGSMANITYDSHRVGPFNQFTTVQMRTFSIAIQPNIVDWSAYGSLRNDTFTINYDGVDSTIILPQGSWDGPSLAEELTTQIADAIGTADITVTYSIPQGKFAFTSSGLTFSLTFDTGISPWLELGFINGATYGPSLILTSTQMVDLSGSSYILIHMPQFCGAMMNRAGGAAVTFGVQTSKAGEYIQTWDAKVDGPSWVQDMNVVTNVNNWTLALSFIRAGVIYPLVGDVNSSYTIDLAFMCRTTNVRACGLPTL